MCSDDWFVHNKYARWYFAIIDRRRTEKVNGYSERHHVLPRSLGGGQDVVRLTAREHFICHRLLVKMTIGANKRKMIFAAYALAHYRAPNRSTIEVSSRVYQKLKHDLSTARKSMPGANLGKHWSPEQRASMKNKTNGTPLAHRGMKRSAETKAKIKAKRAFQVIKRKTWTLQAPDGSIIETQGLKTFCQERKLGLSKLVETEKTKQPVDRGYSKGWMIISTVRK